MDCENRKAIIEAILFASGREVKIAEIKAVLDIESDEIEAIINQLKTEYENRGMEIIKVSDSYQMITKREFYEYLYPLFDNRAKPSLSSAAIETLSIIAYNPKITRAEIEAVRGVSSDSCIYKLLEYGLIEEAEKLDLPGKPRAYKTTNEFLKMFGLSSLDELPELPRYKIDENEQIVLANFLEGEETASLEEKTIQQTEKINMEGNNNEW